MTDREFVEQHWAFAYDELPFGINVHSAFGSYPTGLDCWKAEHWSAAADFTRERLEEIRQLKREIAELDNCTAPMCESDILEWAGCNLDDGSIQEHIVECVRGYAATGRTLARLQRELATLQRGMRVEQP